MAVRPTGSFRYETVTCGGLADHIEKCLRDLIEQETRNARKRYLEYIMLVGYSGKTEFEIIDPLLTQSQISYTMDEFFSAMNTIRVRALKARGLR